MTRKSWREVEAKSLVAGPEGTCIIAEALGYEVIEDFEMGFPYYSVLTPEGMIIEAPASAHDTTSALLSCVAPYTTSLDAAISLLSPNELDFELAPFSGERAVGGRSWHVEFRNRFGTAPSPSLAICRAWLDWKQAEALR